METNSDKTEHIFVSIVKIFYILKVSNDTHIKNSSIEIFIVVI